MSNRASQIILLCEDEEQERLAKQYMRQCDLDTERRVVSKVASRSGGNDSWVLNEFSKELDACRKRNTRTKTLLVVMIDADKFTVEDRSQQLSKRVKSAELEEISNNDPLALLIPKRNIETWICALLGETVDEQTDYKKKKKPTRDDFRKAAQMLYQWTRPKAALGKTCVPSLAAALPEWKKIGSS